MNTSMLNYIQQAGEDGGQGAGTFDIWDLNKSIASLLLMLIQGVCYVLYFIEAVFWSLARGVPIYEGDNIVGYKDILTALFFEENTDTFSNILGYIMIVAIALVVLAMVLSLIKKNFSSKEEDQNPRDSIIGVVKAVLLIIAVPAVMYGALYLSNILVDGICTYSGVGNLADAKESIANQLFMTFGVNVGLYMDNGKYLFSFTLNAEELRAATISINKPTAFIEGQAFQTLINMGFVGNNNDPFGYQYFVALLVMAVVLVALAKAVLLLAKRVFDIAVLYIVSPLAIATYPTDGGKRWGIWGNLMSAKVLSSLGMTIAFIVFITFSQALKGYFVGLGMEGISWASGSGIDKSTMYNIIYIVVLAAGAMAIATTPTLISHLVSEQAGSLAASDQAAVADDMRAGMMLGGGLAKVGVGATLAMLKGKGGTASGASKMMAGASRSNQGGLKSGSALSGLGSGVKALATGGLVGGAVGGIAKGIGNATQARRSNKYEATMQKARASFASGDKAGLDAQNKILKRMGGSGYSASTALAEKKQAAEMKKFKVVEPTAPVKENKKK